MYIFIPMMVIAKPFIIPVLRCRHHLFPEAHHLGDRCIEKPDSDRSFSQDTPCFQDGPDIRFNALFQAFLRPGRSDLFHADLSESRLKEREAFRTQEKRLDTTQTHAAGSESHSHSHLFGCGHVGPNLYRPNFISPLQQRQSFSTQLAGQLLDLSSKNLPRTGIQRNDFPTLEAVDRRLLDHTR